MVVTSCPSGAPPSAAVRMTTKRRKDFVDNIGLGVGIIFNARLRGIV